MFNLAHHKAHRWALMDTVMSLIKNFVGIKRMEKILLVLLILIEM